MEARIRSRRRRNKAETENKRREQASQGGQDKDTHRKSKLAGTIAHQSLLSSNQIFNIFILCREPIALFLDFKHQPITMF